jgi:hypothetical protein
VSGETAEVASEAVAALDDLADRMGFQRITNTTLV